MSEYVMLIASPKIPALNFLDFSWPYIRLSAPPHDPSFNDDSTTAKEQKFTNLFFLSSPHRFSTQSTQYQY